MNVINIDNALNKYFIIYDVVFKKTLLQYLLAEIDLYFGINRNQCWCSTYFNGIITNSHTKKCSNRLSIHDKKKIKLICDQIGDIPDQ